MGVLYGCKSIVLANKEVNRHVDVADVINWRVFGAITL